MKSIPVNKSSNAPALIKVYGERNSGTNYLQQLLTANFDVKLLHYLPPPWLGKLLKYEIQTDLLLHWDRSRTLGWKHGKPHTGPIEKKISSGLRIITVTKNPYAFLLSLHRRPYHYQGTAASDFSTFIRQPWKTILRDHCRGKSFANPIVLWNEKNRSYLELKTSFGQKVVNLTYEQLLTEPEGTLRSLSESLQITRRSDRIVQILRSTKDADKAYSDYLDYYGNQRWKQDILTEDIHFINSQLDVDLLRQLGYRLVL